LPIPVVEELHEHPIPNGYLEYLHLKTSRIMDKAGPANIQESTFSEAANILQHS
jgi:hypothetical protein